MSFDTAKPPRSLVNQTDDIQVLGETGQTVVYLFPDGRALADREKPDFDALNSSSNTSTNSELQFLDSLVSTGKMNAAQKLVVLHDYESTGMNISEILSARGWM